MRTLITTALCWVLVMPLVAFADDLRVGVVAQLKKTGSNVERPHKFDFYFYFPTEIAANAAARELQANGLATQVRRAAKGPEWLCLASGTYVPDAPKLTELGRIFSAVATKHRGEFDGWEAEVIR